ncbi:phosphotransferase family protein [Streptomyces sp. NPDC090052]|uniref:phosphotransferase family protein n=1 Tax=unclassified Streptomyces TaxID=2593676 RepID=UPI00224D555C|nr:phosphotransferase [Streptomyces sp. NBC_01306]MCX4726266.1 aminoglycoside phosphotransferase family protein [Streptomyces sp. NBC_01306]WSX42467.1 aminoglycoside phosphotransferase family protein [Streptomyces sp. NBC_00963]WSX69488.1 aminoglycoside phosphotransferase family protein [Streptomyces sp. NBC_00932]
MDVTRKVVTRDHLEGVARAALGDGRRLAGVARLRGGSKKGVYRLTFDDDFTAIVYIWDDAENFWPTTDPGDADSHTADDHTDPFSHASGIDLFQAANRRLDALGIRTPRILLADRSRSHYPADIAVVEDVPGENLEALLHREPHRMEATLAALAETLGVMRRHTGPGFGKVALIDGGGVSRGRSCEQGVLDRALDDLAEAASRDSRIGRVRRHLEEEVRGLAAAVRPRSEYGLIHGELGPDHVLVDRLGQPVLIDIEGLMFFDVEWEHAFLRIRFREHYRWFDSRGLDEQRLAFYTLAMRLSLVAGPLRLLDGDFPDRDAMMGIAEHNLQQALAFLPSGDC